MRQFCPLLHIPTRILVCLSAHADTPAGMVRARAVGGGALRDCSRKESANRRQHSAVMSVPEREPALPRVTSIPDVLEQLSERGYVGRFSVDSDGLLCCGVCGTCTGGRDASLDGIRMFVNEDNGPTLVVIAVRCRACGSRGALGVDVYGTSGERELGRMSSGWQEPICLMRMSSTAPARTSRELPPAASLESSVAGEPAIASCPRVRTGGRPRPRGESGGHGLPHLGREETGGGDTCRDPDARGPPAGDEGREPGRVLEALHNLLGRGVLLAGRRLGTGLAQQRHAMGCR